MMQNKQMERRAFRSLLKVIFKGETRDTGGLSMTDLGSSSGKPRRGLLARLGLGRSGKRSGAGLFSKLGKGTSYLLMAVAFGLMAALVGKLGYNIGQAGLPLITAFNMSVILVLLVNILFGSMSTVSYLYYVKDIPFYLSLPYRAQDILKAKFIHFAGLSFLGNLIFLPMVLAAGYAQALAWYQLLIYGLAFLMAAASVDLAIIILTVFLVRFSKFAHNRDRFMTAFSSLSMLLAIAFGVGIQFVVNSSSGSDPGQLIGQTATVLGGQWWLQGLLRIFAPPLFFADFLTSGHLAKQILALVLMLAALVFYYWLMLLAGKHYYFDGVMAIQAGAGQKSRRVYQGHELGKLMAKRSTFRSLVRNEYLKLRRTPLFFTQFVLSSVTMPLYMLAIFLVVGFLGLRDSGMSLAEVHNQAKLVMSGLSFADPGIGYASLAILGMSVLGATTSLHAVKVAVSTDGQDFFFYKQMPIKLTTYLRAKATVLFSLAIIPNLLIYLVLGLALGLPAKILAYLLCLMLVGQLLTLTFLLAIGALFPVLNWDSEATLIRGGKNVFWVYMEMIIALALLAGPACLIFFNLRHAWIDFGLSYLLALGLLLLFFLISLVFCYGFAARRLARREG